MRAWRVQRGRHAARLLEFKETGAELDYIVATETEGQEVEFGEPVHLLVAGDDKPDGDQLGVMIPDIILNPAPGGATGGLLDAKSPLRRGKRSTIDPRRLSVQDASLIKMQDSITAAWNAATSD